MMRAQHRQCTLFCAGRVGTGYGRQPPARHTASRAGDQGKQGPALVEHFDPCRAHWRCRNDQLPSHRSKPWMRRSSATGRLVPRNSARRSPTSPDASSSTPRVRPVHSSPTLHTIQHARARRCPPSLFTCLCIEPHCSQRHLNSVPAPCVRTSGRIVHHSPLTRCLAPVQERDLSQQPVGGVRGPEAVG